MKSLKFKVIILALLATALFIFAVLDFKSNPMRSLLEIILATLCALVALGINSDSGI